MTAYIRVAAAAVECRLSFKCHEHFCASAAATSCISTPIFCMQKPYPHPPCTPFSCSITIYFIKIFRWYPSKYQSII